MNDNFSKVSNNLLFSPSSEIKDNPDDLNFGSPIQNNQLNKSRNSMNSMISIANQLPNELEIVPYNTQYNSSLKNHGLKEFTSLKVKLKEIANKISAMNDGNILINTR